MEADNLIVNRHYKSDLPQFKRHWLLYTGTDMRQGQIVYCFWDRQTGLAHWIDPKDIVEVKAK